MPQAGSVREGVVPWGGAAQGAFNCAACERVLIIQYV